MSDDDGLWYSVGKGFVRSEDTNLVFEYIDKNNQYIQQINNKDGYVHFIKINKKIEKK